MDRPQRREGARRGECAQRRHRLPQPFGGRLSVRARRSLARAPRSRTGDGTQAELGGLTGGMSVFAPRTARIDFTSRPLFTSPLLAERRTSAGAARASKSASAWRGSRTIGFDGYRACREIALPGAPKASVAAASADGTIAAQRRWRNGAGSPSRGSRSRPRHDISPFRRAAFGGSFGAAARAARRTRRPSGAHHGAGDGAARKRRGNPCGGRHLGRRRGHHGWRPGAARCGRGIAPRRHCRATRQAEARERGCRRNLRLRKATTLDGEGERAADRDQPRDAKIGPIEVKVPRVPL